MYRRVDKPFQFSSLFIIEWVQITVKLQTYKATGRLKLRVKSTTAVYYAIAGTGPRREFVWNYQVRVWDQFIFLWSMF